MATLIANAVVSIEQWNVLTACDLEGFGMPITHQLATGQVAGYLARLGSGTQEERDRYQEIEDQYRQLTGDRIHVRITPMPPPRPTDMNPSRWTVTTNADPNQWAIEPARTEGLHIEILSDHDIPLSIAGTGKTQLLLWLTLMNVHEDKVVLMDEPDVHLHPRLAEMMAQRLLEPTAQVLVISHSPYMVPAGHLELTRRVYRQHGRSHVTPRLTLAVVKALAVPKRGLEASERLFLYTNAVVFVEGPNDAAVLSEWTKQWAGADIWHRLGIGVQQCEGKLQVAPMVRLADYFSIPSIGIYDFDVLLSKAPHRRTSAKNNRQVLQQWIDLRLVDLTLVEELRLDNQDLYEGRFPSGQIFLMGNTRYPNLESLVNRVGGRKWAEALNAEGYYGPVAYRRWATSHA